MTIHSYNTGLNFTFSNPVTTQNEEKNKRNIQAQQNNADLNTVNTLTNSQNNNKQQTKSENESNSVQESPSDIIKNISAEATKKLSQTTSSKEDNQKEEDILDKLKEQLKILQQELEKSNDMELKMQLLSQIIVIMAQIVELQRILGDSGGLSFKA